MKPTIIALAAALLAPATIAAAAEAPPLKYDIYVRGAFNGWGTDNVLAYQGKGVYEADILVSPGNHAFKIGSKDWNAEWVADPAASVRVDLGRAYPLATEAGPEDYLFTKQTASFRFRVDVSNPAKPVLSVTRLAAPTQAADADPHAGMAGAATLAFATWDGKQESARFSSPDPAAPLRTYVHSTTMQLRDPGPQYASYTEDAALPTVRSGKLAFDALFALALHEMRQDSVKEIRDGNYNGNAPIPCDCFETGEKWHYVWTRDLSYAADLGLAMLDPQRVRNSLEFKLSGWREGVAKAPHIPGTPDGLQIVQDTGSGGSWPVSTDRITWAFAAEETLKNLAPAERPAFAAKALQALSNTVEVDRVATWDAASGLYGGEESFLDWRDQRPRWRPAGRCRPTSATTRPSAWPPRWRKNKATKYARRATKAGRKTSSGPSTPVCGCRRKACTAASPPPTSTARPCTSSTGWARRWRSSPAWPTAPARAASWRTIRTGRWAHR
jgi:hypothetical protein